MKCPECGSYKIKKNGTIHNKKQKYQCNDCGRQFVENPKNKKISHEKKEEVKRAILEKTSLAGVARTTLVSKSWLQKFVNRLYAETPRRVDVLDKPKGSLRIECDELASFAGRRADKVWTWLAKDTVSGEIVGHYDGARDRDSAKKLWESLPPVYRQCAVCFTDFWISYDEVIPAKRHKAVGKETGLTNHIERFNNTLRQRVSRLVRKTLSFSKKLENHIGAIWYFIHHYNSIIRNKMIGSTT